ncbi:MAG: hypothetical protein ACFFE8_15830 [Candidatus Heimdallarchaeota archaeon]
MKRSTVIKSICYAFLFIMVFGQGIVNPLRATHYTIVIKGQKSDLTDLVLDGSGDEWIEVPGASLSLLSLDLLRTVDVEIRIMFNSTHIALLYTVHDDYDFNESDPHMSGHVAVLWAQDRNTGIHMGLDDQGQATTKVDIWHWELETAPGTVVGGKGTATSGDDPVGNFDDEWATSPVNRHDDTSENSLMGAWNHTGFHNGINASGDYVFEMVRPLTTTEEDYDIQMKEGSIYIMALAYWDPDQTPTGWQDSGHMISADSAGWLEVHLGDTGSAPGFEIALTLLGVVTVLVFQKKGLLKRR